jgi:nucleoside-diphosphate-sugar epimerase
MYGFGTLMARTVLVTGATGMIGEALVPLLARRNDVRAIFALTHASEYLGSSYKVTPVRGDVTAGPDLGITLESSREILDRTTVVVHAAANTRFSASLDEARAVNLEGTKNLLVFASHCPRLEAFAALSTVHVAGKRTGTICEEDLDHTEGFVNSYEQSKYETELLLRDHMRELPISVLRLSTVLGSSTTGAVRRMAAIHHALRLYYNSLAPMIPGKPDSFVDLIAVDYAAAAVEHFAAEHFQAGRTFQICAGEDALTLARLLGLTREAFLRYRPSWRKRAIEMPAIVDLPTFELFVRSVEEVGDNILRSSVAIIKHFVPQLVYSKTFKDVECCRSLQAKALLKPSVLEFYPHVVRWLVETGWGECGNLAGGAGR